MLFTGNDIVSTLSDLGITHVVWIPDTSLGLWEPALEEATDIDLVRVCREGEAWPLAAGLIVGGKTPILLMQTTGFFESGDALRNIVFDLKMPVISIVGARNWLNPESTDTAKTFAEPILKGWGVEYQIVATEEDKPKMADWLRQCLTEKKPGIVLLAE